MATVVEKSWILALFTVFDRPAAPWFRVTQLKMCALAAVCSLSSTPLLHLLHSRSPDMLLDLGWVPRVSLLSLCCLARLPIRSVVSVCSSASPFILRCFHWGNFTFLKISLFTGLLWKAQPEPSRSCSSLLGCAGVALLPLRTAGLNSAVAYHWM